MLACRQVKLYVILYENHFMFQLFLQIASSAVKDQAGDFSPGLTLLIKRAPPLKQELKKAPKLGLYLVCF